MNRTLSNCHELEDVYGETMPKPEKAEPATPRDANNEYGKVEPEEEDEEEDDEVIGEPEIMVPDLKVIRHVKLRLQLFDRDFGEQVRQHRYWKFPTVFRTPAPRLNRALANSKPGRFYRRGGCGHLYHPQCFGWARDHDH